MATSCLTTAWLETVRITEVDACGEVLDEFVVSDGTVTVSVSAEVEEGTSVLTKKSNGKVCINRKQPDSLSRYTISIDWCEVDPDIMRLIAGAVPELDGTDVVGYRAKVGALDTAWAFEGWTAVGGDPCDEGGLYYGYFLIPLLRGGIVGDFELGGESTTFTTEGSYTQEGSQWGVGPYDVVGTDLTAGPLAVAMASDEAFLHRLTQVTPPTPSCGAQMIAA
jgi:hypothetical protein